MGPRDSTHEDPVAARCTRLRAATGADGLRFFLAAIVLGPAIWFGSFLLVSRFELFRRGVGGLTAPAGASVGAALRDIVAWLGQGDAIARLCLFGVLLWLLPAIARGVTDWSIRRGYRGRIAHRKTMRRRAVGVVAMLVAMWVIATFGLWLGGVGGEAALLVGSLFACKAACIAVAGALTARRGARVVCSRCDYPMGSWSGAGVACPECGHRWKRRWGARFGVRAVHRGWLAAGFGLLAAAVAMHVLAMVISKR